MLKHKEETRLWSNLWTPRGKRTSQVLVLTAQGFDGVVGLFNLSLNAEEFSGIAASLLLGIFQLGLEVIDLGLPLGDCLVETTLLLLKVVGIGVGLNKNNKVSTVHSLIFKKIYFM